MTPLLTIDLAGSPFRIYASPLDVPDHPWASFDDLMTMSNMDDFEQMHWLAKLQREVPDMVHELPDGTVILAEPMVSDTFRAWSTIGWKAAQSMLDSWTDAWMDLFAVQLAQLSDDQWPQAAHEAEMRNVTSDDGLV